METMLSDLRRFIRHKVVEGFDGVDDVTKQAMTLFVAHEASNFAYFDFLSDRDKRYPRSVLWPHAERIVREEFAAQAETERTWVEPTDCDRLERAFEQLNREGIVALHNAGATLSDAISVALSYAKERTEPTRGYCVYHGQDVDNVVPSGGSLHLGFGSFQDDAPDQDEQVGQDIVRALRDSRIEIEWDGSAGSRIGAQLADWRKRQQQGRDPGAVPRIPEIAGEEWATSTDFWAAWELLTGDEWRWRVASCRKWYLTALAAVHRIMPLLRDAPLRRVVELFDRFVEGTGSWSECWEARRDARPLLAEVLEERPQDYSAAERFAACAPLELSPVRHEIRTVLDSVVCAAGCKAAPDDEDPQYIAAKIAEERELLALTRDIFGNPFLPVVFDPEWRTTTAVTLAQQMYDSRDFSAMPILADALQDAGCDNGVVLAHCRGPGPHVRGCWVVDLVLGKE